MTTHNTDTALLLKKWGVTIEPALLERALTHRSWAYENNTLSYERLEFFGDSILGFFAAQYIFLQYKKFDEGDMSKIKAASVSEPALAEIARDLGLGQYIRLGKGEAKHGGREKDSILSDVVEALIAATYITHGTDITKRIVEKHVVPKILQATKMGPALDWRTAVDEKARELGIKAELEYEILATGPDHAREYIVSVFFAGTNWGTGRATSQKAAKLVACKVAYDNLVANTPIAVKGK